MSKTIREALDNYCEQLTGQRPETRTILDSLNAITEANGGTPSQGGLVDAIDCFCACSGGQSVVLGDIPAKMETTAEGFAAYVTELVIPEGVTSTGASGSSGYEIDKCFENFTNLKKITIPKSLVETKSSILGDMLLVDGTYTGMGENTDGIEVVIANGATAICDDAFCYAQKVTKVTIPKTVERIGYGAFSQCDIQGTLDIPSSVTAIDDQAFRENANLERVVIHGAPTMESGSFLYCNKLSKITVNAPENSIAGAPWGATNAQVIWTG